MTQHAKIMYSLKQGLRFYFYHQEIEIKTHINVLTGTQTVSVNGKQISQINGWKAWRLTNHHTFKIVASVYEVELNTVSVIKGKLNCSLIKDGVHITTLKWDPKQYELASKTRAQRIKEMLIGGTLGLMLGYVISTVIVG